MNFREKDELYVLDATQINKGLLIDSRTSRKTIRKLNRKMHRLFMAEEFLTDAFIKLKDLNSVLFGVK